MYIGQYENKKVAIKCDSEYKRYLLWKDCVMEGIKVNTETFFKGSVLNEYKNSVFIISNKKLDIMPYKVAKKFMYKIVDYRLPRDDVKNISNGIVFKQKGKRIVAKRILNGNVIKKRSSLCYDDDIFNSAEGEQLATYRLLQDIVENKELTNAVNNFKQPYQILENLKNEPYYLMTPYLSIYGKVGEQTTIQYADGTFAYVGDLVIVKENNPTTPVTHATLRPIVKLKNDFFVMGLYNCKFNKGENENYSIIKYSNYKELNNYKSILEDCGLSAIRASLI